MKNKVVFGLLAGVLVLAVLLIAYGEMRPLERRFHGSVKDLLPKPEEIPGWTVQYLPIADTPEMQAKVDELLNFDEGIFAVYTKDSRKVSIYIAYWGPGRMPIKEIARHTPDVCWVNAGWKQTMRDVTADLRAQESDETIPHTENRIFIANGITEHVAFWHLVGREIHSYGTGGRPPWHAVIRDTLRWGANQRQEQFFIRISSNRSLPEFISFGPAQKVLKWIGSQVST